MAGLNTLPNELLNKIVEYIAPEDVENFAQASGHIYAASQSFLIGHRALIRRYRFLHVRGGDPELEDELVHSGIPKLLHETIEIIINPRLASYIRRIDLGHTFRKPLENEGAFGNIDASKYIKDSEYNQQVDILNEAVKQSPLSEEGARGYDVEEDTLSLAVLVPMLSNLSTLRMDWSTYHHCVNVFRRLPALMPHALPRLARIFLPRGTQARPRLADLHVFSALPSVRLIYACALWCDEEDYNINISPYHQESHVTDLMFFASDICSKSVCESLSGFDCLESFVYEDEKKWLLKLYPPIDASMLRNALSAQARHSLRDLTILSSDFDQSFMGSLQDFSKLETLRTEYGFVARSKSQDGTNGTGLAKHLPRNLRQLTLRDHAGFHRSSYLEDLGSLVAAKQTGKLQLTKVILVCPTIDGSEMVVDNEYKDGGISFSFISSSAETDGVALLPRVIALEEEKPRWSEYLDLM